VSQVGVSEAANAHDPTDGVVVGMGTHAVSAGDHLGDRAIQAESSGYRGLLDRMAGMKMVACVI
jgi:hypothetical protein